MPARSLADLKGLFNPTNLSPVTRDELLAVLYKADRKIGLPISEFRAPAAGKDVLGDTATGAVLGLADTIGAPLLGTTTAGGGTATSNQSAIYSMCLPGNYLKGGNLRVGVRAKVSALATVSATVDATLREVGDAGIGSDLVTTAAQNLTIAYADYYFDLSDESTLEAGDNVIVQVALARDDTGGALSGAPSITKVWLEYEGG